MLRDDYSPGNRDTERLKSALKFGVMAATMNVEKIGCHPPTKEQVEERLN